MEKIKYKEGLILGSHKVPEDRVEIDASKMREIKYNNSEFCFDGDRLYIAIRGGGEFADIALYLSECYDWVLCKDSTGAICLVPLKKETK